MSLSRRMFCYPNQTSISAQVRLTESLSLDLFSAISQAVSLPSFTGVDTAAHAVFTLSTLSSYGILVDEGVPKDRGGASAMVRLHNAANAGSSEALLALADRFAHGHGVPRDEVMAVKFAKLAADRIVMEIEQASLFAFSIMPLFWKRHHACLK